MTFFRNVEPIFFQKYDLEDKILTKFVLSILKEHKFLHFMFYLAKFELILHPEGENFITRLTLIFRKSLIGTR